MQANGTKTQQFKTIRMVRIGVLCVDISESISFFIFFSAALFCCCTTKQNNNNNKPTKFGQKFAFITCGRQLGVRTLSSVKRWMLMITHSIHKINLHPLTAAFLCRVHWGTANVKAHRYNLILFPFMFGVPMESFNTSNQRWQLCHGWTLFISIVFPFSKDTIKLSR